MNISFIYRFNIEQALVPKSFHIGYLFNIVLPQTCVGFLDILFSS